MDAIVVNLDDEQRDAVGIPLDGRQIILAGPGSGKTEVVAALVARLVDDEGLEADGEILVVSFSRAAIEAVGRRVLDEAGRAGVSVTTLDALAGQVLREQTDLDWQSMSFDERVRYASDEVREHGFERGRLLGHVIIDEVQDIVGDRAYFIMALLGHLPDMVGFTLLGDPAQAIYDFQNGDGTRNDANQLLESVRALHDVRTIELRGQYRAATRGAVRAAALRNDIIGGDGPDAVDDFGARVVPIGSWVEVASLIEGWPGVTAVLTRTNGEALRVCDELARLGLTATLREPSAQQPFAPWLATALGRWERRSIGREEFRRVWQDIPCEMPADRVWLTLRGLTRSRTAVIEIPALAARLRRGGRAPAALSSDGHGAVVVSTIHRAKGLEFDNVVVIRRKPREDDDVDAEARVSYVAYTRARAQIVSAPDLHDWRLRRDQRSRRWMITGLQAWQTNAFEVRGGDLERLEPPGDDREASQARIERLATGSPLTLMLDQGRSRSVPIYGVYADDVLVGRTSEEFGTDLKSRVRFADPDHGGMPAWPSLTGARVGAIETVCGQPTGSGVGRWGMWLGVRPVGMLSLRWNGDVDA